jgi:prepilin-type N-terminal cleavage/methylation domain-containing protein
MDPRGSRNRRAFTLIELMIVLSIIVIVVAMAIPVWSTLSGNNSVATATNQIAAMLGNARADALYNHQMTGVFFFLDPTSGQFAMAEVQADLAPQGAGGGYYPSYTPLTMSPTGAPAAADGPVTPLEMVNYLSSSAPASSTAGSQQYIFYRDVVLLPSGVGVALSNNSNPYGATPAPGLDRYLRCGVIMFDATGVLTTIPYAVPMVRQTPYTKLNNTKPTHVDQLAVRLGLISNTTATIYGDLASLIGPPIGSTNYFPLISQSGLLVYDHNAYLNQRTTNGTSPNQAFTDGDLQCELPANANTIVTTANKIDEENWLDQNGVAFLVSPFNGSLIKAR